MVRRTGKATHSGDVNITVQGPFRLNFSNNHDGTWSLALDGVWTEVTLNGFEDMRRLEALIKKHGNWWENHAPRRWYD